MKIFRVAEESLAPSWISEDKSMKAYDKKSSVLKDEVERLNATASEKVTEDTLVKECEEIEKCAASDKIYHYNSNWSNDTVAHLKEYASAVGLDKSKVIGIDPSEIMQDINQIERKVEASTISKTASKLVLEDPFHLEKLSDTSHMEKKDWERVERQLDLEDRPQMHVGVIPMRGGEDYFKNSDSKLAKNQNSITSPDSIKSLIDSTELDTGVRLKQEKVAKEAAKVQEHKDWEKGIIAAMEKKDIVPKGTVFPTEVMNAQPGLKTPSSQMGVYAKFDKDSIPEKTEGEKIKEARKEWNDTMKRAAKEKATFEMSGHKVREISETFSEELKKALKK